MPIGQPTYLFLTAEARCPRSTHFTIATLQALTCVPCLYPFDEYLFVRLPSMRTEPKISFYKDN